MLLRQLHLYFTSSSNISMWIVVLLSSHPFFDCKKLYPVTGVTLVSDLKKSACILLDSPKYLSYCLNFLEIFFISEKESLMGQRKVGVQIEKIDK